MAEKKRDYKKEFKEALTKISPHLSMRERWECIISIIACAISNSTEPDPKRRQEREKEYENSLKRLDCTVEEASEFYTIIVAALNDAVQNKGHFDFLSELYMELRLNDKIRNQIFTPYHIADVMAQMTMDGIKNSIEKDGYATVYDPCCGAGILLCGTADAIKSHGYNYQTQAFFVGQDIDRLAVQMCYIQLSLLGCAGYVCVADTLKYPLMGESVLIPRKTEEQEFFFTPLYYRDIWQERIEIEIIKSLLNKPITTNNDKTVPMKTEKSKSDKKDKAS